MSSLEVGLFIMPNKPVRQVTELVRLSEELGFDFVGVMDGQMIWRDVYIALTAAALATRRLRLGPWVTNPITRHPTVTANAICTLDEISEGRAFLGIGTGDDSVKTIGKKAAKLDRLAEAVTTIRQLALGRQVETPDGTWNLASAQGRITIYWAGANPRSLSYGGRYADGVISSGWLVPELLSEARHVILEGAALAGKRASDVTTIFNSAVSVDENRERAIDAAKPYLAHLLGDPSSTRLPGWTEEDRARWKAQYDYYYHFRSDHTIASRVPGHLVPRKAVAGTPDECVELLRLVVESGFDKIVLFPIGDVESNIRLLANKVLPRL